MNRNIKEVIIGGFIGGIIAMIIGGSIHFYLNGYIIKSSSNEFEKATTGKESDIKDKPKIIENKELVQLAILEDIRKSIDSLSIQIKSFKENLEINSKEQIGVPTIYGMTYDEAREKIIKKGWIPVKQRWQESLGESGVASGGNGKIFWERGYHEVEACSGFGEGFCRFLFSDPIGRKLAVVTAGEEDSENEYHAIVQDVRLVEVE